MSISWTNALLFVTHALLPVAWLTAREGGGVKPSNINLKKQTQNKRLTHTVYKFYLPQKLREVIEIYQAHFETMNSQSQIL